MPIEVVAGVNTHKQPLNGPGAKNTGIELIARQRLSFLPGPLKGLSLFATGTNLTHRPQVSYTGTKVFPEDVSYSGRKYTFGVEYRF